MLAASGALAGTPNLLHVFKADADGGELLSGLVADANGNLYGTRSGIAFHSGLGGSVYEMIPPASASGSWAVAILHDFVGGKDGMNPQGGLVFDKAGNLYGMTREGGTGTACGAGTLGCGVIYRLSPPTAGSSDWTETILFQFNGVTGGVSPTDTLTIDATGNLYGVTAAGGFSQTCCGVVFRLSPSQSGLGQWTQTILYAFTGAADGRGPVGPVTTDSKGNLYGAAASGSKGSCCGVIYKLSPRTSGSGPWSETVLHSFTRPDGNGVEPDLAFDPAGNLYGAVFAGAGGGKTCTGATGGCGEIFELSPPIAGASAWTYQRLYRFAASGKTGFGNPGPVRFLEGKLYGTAGVGINNGTLFALEPGSRPASRWVLDSYGDFTSVEGFTPNGPLVTDPAVSGSGTFYGTTGNAYLGGGTVYSWKP
jgi:hypothetical protein